ncbi:MAG: phosphate ABC transporter substrate-binding protein, PhoT family, partial [Raineya sp.]
KSDKDVSLPSQSAFAKNIYPLRRECYVLVKGGRIGLAHAWATFISQEIGQRIILKAGLLPAKIPPREIEMISE